jgi:hypothetical protein
MIKPCSWQISAGQRLLQSPATPYLPPSHPLLLKSKTQRAIFRRSRPEVGLEPTTLRLTANEFPSPTTAIDCCK